MSSDFEVVGTVELTPGKRSLRMKIDDNKMLHEDYYYYVSVADIQKILREPSKAVQIVKLKDPENLEKWKGI